MKRRYESGRVSFLVTFGPLSYTVRMDAGTQRDIFDVNEYSMYPVTSESYTPYCDLLAWLIAGLLSESQYWSSLAEYSDDTDAFVITAVTDGPAL